MTQIPDYEIDYSVLPEERRGFRNYIAWRSRIPEGAKSGHFLMDADQGEQAVLAQPGWRTSNRSEGDVFEMLMMRAQIIAIRRRKSILDSNDVVHYYDWFTPKRAMEPGVFRSHIQVLLRLAHPDDSSIVQPGLWILSLKGYGKTTAWDNPFPGQPYHNPDFPAGVGRLIDHYLQKVADERGLPRSYPPFTLWVDLLPALDANNKALQIRLGSGQRSTVINPFTVNLGESRVWPIASRWVSRDLVEEAQEILRADPGWVRWQSSVLDDHDAETLAEDEFVPF